MRRFDMSAVFAEALHRREAAEPFREVGVPLYIECPPYEGRDAPAFDASDAEEARIEAGGITIGGDEDAQ